MNVFFIILFYGDNVTKNMLSFQEKKHLKAQTITSIAGCTVFSRVKYHLFALTKLVFIHDAFVKLLRIETIIGKSSFMPYFCYFIYLSKSKCLLILYRLHVVLVVLCCQELCYWLVDCFLLTGSTTKVTT